MKFISLAAGTVGLLTMTMISSGISEVVWKPVPGTRTTDEISRNRDFWYVGTNSINRRGNSINFDVKTNSSQYVRYSANCRTRMMSRLSEGRVKNGKIIVVERYQEAYFSANQIQRKVLDYACSQN